eukprot:TRINITY_DN24875_c0_g1_i1.p1 TRINITY_DN24875_c0_g1~~TRINITY_DN24875_c0_g1_i1.p1  ORF type:complete len:278 (-),score=24.37 TRINITY_DN24875_c0_g1_i1:202-1035(-)
MDKPEESFKTTGYPKFSDHLEKIINNNKWIPPDRTVVKAGPEVFSLETKYWNRIQNRGPLMFHIGAVYLTGTVAGGITGSFKGFLASRGSPYSRLRLNSMLNYAGRAAATTGPAAATLAFLFQSSLWTYDVLRDGLAFTPDENDSSFHDAAAIDAADVIVPTTAVALFIGATRGGFKLAWKYLLGGLVAGMGFWRVLELQRAGMREAMLAGVGAKPIVDDIRRRPHLTDDDQDLPLLPKEIEMMQAGFYDDDDDNDDEDDPDEMSDEELALYLPYIK